MVRNILLALVTLSALTYAKVTEIKSVEQFKQIIAQEDKLLVFDLYADWCAPCRMLAPVLDEVAEEVGDLAQYYKINTEKLPAVAQQFGVQGIPYVVYLKDKAVVNAITGVYPKEEYIRATEILSGSLKEEADGVVNNGVREITLNSSLNMQNIFVYRGDKVALTVTGKDAPFSVSLPEQKATSESKKGEAVTLSFTAREPGTYPIFCNSKSDIGTGERKGWLIVMDYKATSDKAIYKEMSAAEFAAHSTDKEAVLVDVRTPNEFYDGHITDAKLIPVQQLEQRLSELAAYKNKPVYLYCRSGNRSTVAAKILMDRGFTEVYNLRRGIKDWKKSGKKVVK